MPITSSAKKRIRRDSRRRILNARVRTALKQVLKTAQRNPSADKLKAAQKALDKAARSRLIHPNRAARLKSQLAKKGKLAPKGA
ncbi:hypothetical protein A2V68_00605 [candidate division Kazan bacterium RBG_13_50_9]|uniref:Small ribosomal subunit protein bS20 n=1 Tax=candidate division Kazan bacterium RBG_13_50_9 TaxID=1798535 RepID=A0A1F4NRY8_UNCK3|nr:MAG: hypothetical protein A2V68_00605 [candidate division Kazan bacterium RBG_13_50_9]